MKSLLLQGKENSEMNLLVWCQENMWQCCQYQKAAADVHPKMHCPTARAMHELLDRYHYNNIFVDRNQDVEQSSRPKYEGVSKV
jgi:hypothetical protein